MTVYGYSFGVLSLVLASNAAQAESILYCNDYNVGTDRMAMALDGFESTHDITRTTSLSSCDSMIGSGGWDLLFGGILSHILGAIRLGHFNSLKRKNCSDLTINST